MMLHQMHARQKLIQTMLLIQNNQAVAAQKEAHRANLWFTKWETKVT